MQPKILVTREEFAALRDEWNALVRETGEFSNSQDATSTYDWFTVLADAFLGDAQIRVVALADGGRCVAVQPLVIGKPNPLGHGLYVPTLLYGGRNDFLVDMRNPMQLGRLLGAVDEAFPRWTHVRLSFTEGSAALAHLTEQGWCIEVESRLTSPYFRLESEAEAFWRRCSRNTREQIRKSRSKLGAMGRVECRLYESPGDAQTLLDHVLAIERRSWKHEAGTAITCRPDQERFYRLMLPRLMGLGQLLGAVLYVDGTPVAHHFGLVRDGVFCCLKHSQDAAYDAARPSYFVNRQLIDDLISRGVTWFDFMGRIERHKMGWSPDTLSYTRLTCTLFAPNWRGQIASRWMRARRRAAAMLTRHPAGAAQADEAADAEPAR